MLQLAEGPQAESGAMQGNSLLDRQRGCLLGLAVGDALGAAVEFRPPGSFEPVGGYRGGGPHRLAPGEWTDDTSMALALAGSIADAGWDLNDQSQRYVRWWREGEYSVTGECFDIGITTSRSLARFEQSQDALTSGDRSEDASGNGSIMRLAPVAIHFADLLSAGGHADDRSRARVGELARLAAESSLPTHASEQCLSACRFLAIVLAGLIEGVPRERALAADWEPFRQLEKLHPLHPAISEVAQGSYCCRHPPEIQSSGYVVKSLEAALWAFHDATDFREAVLKAVNLGDDADTTGAVCGQLAGAYWGESGIPDEWLAGLARREMIERALRGIVGRVGARV
jgi:ADP-ribosylglycohydrolase